MQMKRMRRATGMVVAMSLSHGAAAHAESRVFGTVIDSETRKPLVDVIVTATSPAIQGEQVLVTDTEGHYRLSELPPGLYTLRFDKEGFRPANRPEVRVPPDQGVGVDVALESEGYEEITLNCGGVTIDVTSTTTETWGDPDLSQWLPLNRPLDRGGASRSFESLAALAPGARSEAYGVSINGASPFENAYTVDGLSTQDPVLGINSLPLSVEFLMDSQLITSGYAAKYGHATGGVFRARTWSGGNALHGSVFGHWAPGALGATPSPTSGPTWTISGQNKVDFQGDLGATLGGSLVKDRLWFFAGVAPALTQVEHTRTLNATTTGADGARVHSPIPGTSRGYFADERGLQAIGKLTYRINPDHDVALSLITTPTHSGGGAGTLTVDRRTGGLREFINATPDPTSVGNRVLDGNSTLAALHYRGAFLDKRMLVEAHLGWSHQTASDESLAPSGLTSTVYLRRRPVTYYEPTPEAARGCGTDEAEQLSRCPVLFYASGSDDHTSLDTADRYQAHASSIWLFQLAGQHVLEAGVDAELLTAQRIRENLLQREVATYGSTLLGGFMQDSWTLFNRFTLNAGIRYDSQGVYTADGTRAFVLGNPWSPRVGLVVDPLATGQMKLFAHYAKYRGQMPLEPMRAAYPSGTPVGSVPVDPWLAPPSSSELVAGAALEVLRNVALSATYTHRSLDSVIQLLSRDEGTAFFLGNPGTGLASDSPKAERTHDAMTVALHHELHEGWFLQASYTWSRLYGNQAGPFQSSMGWGEQTLAPESTLPSQGKNRSGPLPGDRTHAIKVFAIKRFMLTRNLSASLGLSYQGLSGTPINYLGADPILGMGQTFVLPRGSSGGRTPWVHVIDSNVGVHYQLTPTQRVSLTLEAFNLFNFQQVTRVNEHYTYASVLPLEEPVPPGALTPGTVTTTRGQPLDASDVNPEFKKPIQYQAPRQVRVGLRYTF